MAKASRVSENTIEVSEWGVRLDAKMKIEHETGYIGIRANHIRIVDESTKENCFKVWIADESDGPFRTFLYLKIGSKPEKLDDFHFQCEISREQRNEIKDSSKPFYVYLNPEHVFFVEK